MNCYFVFISNLKGNFLFWLQLVVVDAVVSFVGVFVVVVVAGGGIGGVIEVAFAAATVSATDVIGVASTEVKYVQVETKPLLIWYNTIWSNFKLIDEWFWIGRKKLEEKAF